MADVTYISRVRIERLGGPQRLAYLSAEDEPVIFGVHSEIAEHSGVRIKVTYRLTAAPERHPEVERVHGFHARFCPVARSLAGAIEITTQLELR